MSSPLLKRLDQLYVAALTAGTLTIVAAWWLSQGGPWGRIVDIDRASQRHYEFLVDVNSAAWPELAQLPDVGEVLARRIVAFRETSGPFNDPEDLLRVNGIGVRRLAKIRGHLLPLPGNEVVVTDR